MAPDDRVLAHLQLDGLLGDERVQPFVVLTPECEHGRLGDGVFGVGTEVEDLTDVRVEVGALLTAGDESKFVDAAP